MTADRDLERRLTELYGVEPFVRAPDRVLHTALVTIDTTRQRRPLVRAPWRFRTMNSFVKMAMAATTIVVIGGLGLALVGPGRSDIGGPPPASPSPSVAPTSTPSPTPTRVVPAALTETHTSARHGYSISYPKGWLTQDATAPWNTGFPLFRQPEGDFLYHPTLQDHLFVVVVSRPLEGQDGSEWAREWLIGMGEIGGECQLPLERSTIDGGAGWLCTGFSTAATWAGDRGYVIMLYVSGDDPENQAAYDREYFETLLATMRLEPASAVDGSPGPSPSASPSASG